MVNIKFMSEKEVAKDIFAQIINKIENTGNTSVYYYNFVSKNISYYTKYDNKNKDLINTVLKTNLQDIYANLPSGWEILFGKNTNNKNSPDLIYLKVKHGNKEFNMDGSVWTKTDSYPSLDIASIIRNKL